MSNKTAAVLLALAAAFTAASCAKAPPVSPADEIRLHSWYLPSQQARLFFEGSEMLLVSDGDAPATYIKGRCFTDDDTLTVLSETAGTVILTYRLINDRLELTYSGRTAEFVKDDDFIELQ